MVLPRIDDSHLTQRQRRVVAMTLAASVCIALAITSITLGGHAADGTGFLFFILSLPWTLSVWAVTMLLGINSPAAVFVALAIPTALVWRVLSNQLIKRCVG